MNRLVAQTLGVVSCVVLATAFTPACAENDQSIFIRNVLHAPQNRQNGCLYTNDPTQAALFEGLLDVSARDTYETVLLVGSELMARGDMASTRAESNRTHINGAVVRVTDPNGGELATFTSVASGFVEPQLLNSPSFGPVQITAIDAASTARLGAGLARGQTKLVLANIKVYGKTLGGVDLESGEFQFPIRICNGCLVSFAGADDPATPGLDCLLPLSPSAATTLPCYAGQDEVTPCQLCTPRPGCTGELVAGP